MLHKRANCRGRGPTTNITVCVIACGKAIWFCVIRGGGYHLAGEECHGYDKQAVKVGEKVPLCDKEGVEVGGEAAAHLLE